MTIPPPPTLEATLYKRCPTCQRLTPAESQRCYECWNDVASAPILEPEASAAALARQTEADLAVSADRARRRERLKRLRRASTTVVILALAVLAYRLFLYTPPLPPLATQPSMQLDVSAATWPIEGGSLAGTRATDARPALAGAAAWTIALGVAPRTPLVAGADRLIAALENGRIVAIDARSGSTLWTAELPNPPVAAPTLAAGRVFVPQLSGRLLVLDADTGAPIYETPVVSTSFSTSPMVADGIVYLFGTGELVAFDAATGRLLWSQDIDSGWAFVTPVMAGAHIAVATGDRTLIFDRLRGTQTYYYEFERAQPYSIVLADDTVYSLSARFGAAMEVTSERPWWEYGRIYWTQFWVWGMAPEPPPPPSLWVTSRPPRDGYPVAVAADRILVAGNTPPARNAAPLGDLRAVARSDGAPLWQKQVDPIVAAPTLTADGLLVVHAQRLALYDIGDGRMLAERTLEVAAGATLESTVVTSHGTYAITSDGVLFALR